MELFQVMENVRTPRQTVEVMRTLARRAAHSPFVRCTAEDILRCVPENNPARESAALYDYVRLGVRYTGDIDNLETLKTPEYLITEIETMGTGTGDCDDMSLLLAALLVTSGYRCRFVLGTSWWNDSGESNHVYVQYFNPLSQSWVSLDPIIKDEFAGYEGEFKEHEVFDI